MVNLQFSTMKHENTKKKEVTFGSTIIEKILYLYAHVRCIVFILALDLSAQIFHIFFIIFLWNVQPAALEQ